MILKSRNFRLILIIGSFLCLTIGTLVSGVIVFSYIVFIHDLAQLAQAEFWNRFILKMGITMIIFMIGIILGLVIKCSNIKKILMSATIGYLLPLVSAYAAYSHIIDFPIQIFIGIVTIILFLASFLFILNTKYI